MSQAVTKEQFLQEIDHWRSYMLKRARWYVRRHPGVLSEDLVEEAVNDALISIWQSRSEELREIQHPEAVANRAVCWALSKILRRECKRRERSGVGVGEFDLEDRSGPPVSTEQVEELFAILRQRPDLNQTWVEVAYRAVVLGHSRQTIAAEMEMTPYNVNACLYRFGQRLSELVASEGIGVGVAFAVLAVLVGAGESEAEQVTTKDEDPELRLAFWPSDEQMARVVDELNPYKMPARPKHVSTQWILGTIALLFRDHLDTPGIFLPQWSEDGSAWQYDMQAVVLVNAIDLLSSGRVVLDNEMQDELHHGLSDFLPNIAAASSEIVYCLGRLCKEVGWQPGIVVCQQELIRRQLLGNQFDTWSHEVALSRMREGLFSP